MNNNDNAPLNPPKVGTLPALRFPEFRGTEGWEEKTLGEIADVSKLAGYEFTKHVTYENKGEIIALRGLNIKNNDLDLTDVKYIDNSDLSKLSRSKLYIDDLMFTYIGTIGEVALIKENNRFYLAPNVSRIRVNKNYINPKYIIQYFNLDKFKSVEIAKYVSSSSQPALSMENVRKFEIIFPTLAEQQKIASCLSSLDDLISAQSEKIEAYKTHKKGLMQQLFPAEGESVPALRFAEFVESEGWEEKQLNEVCEINPSIKGLPEKFVYIDLESVENGVLLKKKIITLADSPSRAQRLLKFGDIIFQTVRPYQKNNYFFQIDDENSYVASTGYAQLRANEDRMYLFQYLHNQRFVNRVLEKCSGSNYPAINSSDLSEITIEIPTLAEQQKIASCLSSLDAVIQAESDKLEAYKAHKKGLMQQLFPNTNEVEV